MSLNAAHVTTMVFSDETSKAVKEMRRVVEASGEKIVKEYDNQIHTTNGKYVARRWSESCRGYRYQNVYIDHVLKHTEANDHIMMKLFPPHYYKDTFEKEEDYSWRDHVHYF